jgi:hypothetical protein
MAPHSDHETEVDTFTSIRDVDIPILIVGGGPAGLLLAHMLWQLGGLTTKNHLLLSDPITDLQQ